jgi:low affinity Fe/Cu permease
VVNHKNHDEDPPKAHPGIARTGVAHYLNAIAGFLSTAVGFIATIVVLLIGIAIGMLISFNDFYMLGFNLFLSLLAIIFSGIILVSGARSEAALHVKLDYLIRYSRAKNSAIGLEHKEVEEIEAERKAIEKDASEHLDEAIEEAVEEEVAEQLGSRKAKPKEKA